MRGGRRRAPRRRDCEGRGARRPREQRPRRGSLADGGRGLPGTVAAPPHRGPEGPVGARRGARQGLRARQRPLGHLRPRLPRLPPSRRGRARHVGGRLPARPHRAAQEAPRRPPVAAQHGRRRGRARPARRLVRGRRRAPARRRAAARGAGARGAAAPDDHLAPAADRRQGAGGLPRPARARRAARRHARADLAPLPALGARAGCGDPRGGAGVAAPGRRQLGARRGRRRARAHQGVDPPHRPRPRRPVVVAAVGAGAGDEDRRGDARPRQRAPATGARAADRGRRAARSARGWLRDRRRPGPEAVTPRRATRRRPGGPPGR